MNNMTTYLKNKILTDNISSKDVYIALFSNDVEVSGMGYSRQKITTTVAEDGQITNNAQVAFPIATGNWGEITHIGLTDSPTLGNMLFYGEAFYTKYISESSQYTIPKNYLIIRLL